MHVSNNTSSNARLADVVPSTSRDVVVDALRDQILPANPAAPSILFSPTKRQRQMDAYIPKKISAEQKKTIDADLIDLFIDAFHPFSLVEERSFKKFARWIPAYVLPTRKTISNSMLPEIYHKTKMKIQNQEAIEA